MDSFTDELSTNRLRMKNLFFFFFFTLSFLYLSLHRHRVQLQMNTMKIFSSIFLVHQLEFSIANLLEQTVKNSQFSRGKYFPIHRTNDRLGCESHCWIMRMNITQIYIYIYLHCYMAIYTKAFSKKKNKEERRITR